MGKLRLHDPPRFSENATGCSLLEELRASNHATEHDRVVNFSIQVSGCCVLLETDRARFRITLRSPQGSSQSLPRYVQLANKMPFAGAILTRGNVPLEPTVFPIADVLMTLALFEMTT